MVNAQSCIAGICVAEIIPESIDLIVGIKFAHRICPPLRYQFFEGGAGLGTKQCIVNPSFRLLHVHFRWHHIVIAGQHHRLV